MGTDPHATGSRAAERGPYLDHLPVMFTVDDRGFAWAVWEDGTMSMVVSTPLNYEHRAHAFYVPAPQFVLKAVTDG